MNHRENVTIGVNRTSTRQNSTECQLKCRWASGSKKPFPFELSSPVVNNTDAEDKPAQPERSASSCFPLPSRYQEKKKATTAYIDTYCVIYTFLKKKKQKGTLPGESHMFVSPFLFSLRDGAGRQRISVSPTASVRSTAADHGAPERA